MSLKEVQDYFNNNDPHSAMKVIDKLIQEDPYKLDYLEAKIQALNMLKRFDEALHLLDRNSNEIKTCIDVRLAIDRYNALFGMELFDEAQDHIFGLKDFLDNIGLELDKSTLYRLNYALAIQYQRKGNLEAAIELIKDNINLLIVLEPDDSGKKKAYSFYKLGVLYDYLGRLKDATHYYNKALGIFKEHPDKALRMKAHYNLAGIYSSRGLLDDCYTNINSAIELANELADTNFYAHCLMTLGSYNFALGDIPETLRIYSEAQQLFHEEGNWNDHSFVYANYFEMYYELNEKDQAKHYFTEFEKTLRNRKISSHHGELLRLYRAQLGKISQVTRTRAKAMDEFEKISNGPIVDHVISAKARIEYINMLLEDFHESGNKAIYNEITKNLRKLEDFAFDEEISHLLAQSYLFQSKLCLIEGKVERSTDLLERAKGIAVEYGYDFLRMAISSEYDYLYEVVNSQENTFASLSLKEKIVESKLDRLVALQSSTRPKIVKVEEVTFYNLSIFKDDGKNIHTTVFNDTEGDRIDNQILMVETLISAVQNTEHLVERLDSGHVTSLIEVCDGLVCVLIFKGSSYLPSIKLDALREEIAISREMKSLSDTDLVQLLPDIVRRVFQDFV